MVDIDEVRRKICIGLNDLKEEDLSRMYSDLMNIRDKFLSTSFCYYTLEEVEQERFELQELLLNIRILLREKKKLDCRKEIKQMQKLFN